MLTLNDGPRRRAACGRRAPAILLLLAAALCACTHTSNGLAPGSLTFHMPGVLPPAARTPPPRLAAAPTPRTGPYTGSGHLVFNPGARGACRDVIPIADFAVAGNSASFRGSSAEINRDGSVQIQAGRRWVTGYFAGPRFEGRLWEPPPACTYALSLAPVG